MSSACIGDFSSEVWGLTHPEWAGSALVPLDHHPGVAAGG